ncbi:MAG: medium chain dehydrogenase/reductase family protein [Flavobacteriales bacterium]|nr:medium chain dehydrogenase/reductase family protein [Flavobacteriales bacterium]
MKKVVIYKAGSHDQIKVEDVASPTITDGECKIKVKAIGINYADTIIRQGLYASAKEYVGWPITPGFEVSGVISEVGKDCKKFKVGDEVFAITRFGGYTEEICLEESLIFPKPAAFSFDEAAGFPAVFMTAYHALFQNFVLRKGSDVLVHSAAGGMGTALLQLLKIHECNTIGVVGGDHKVQVAKDAGANHVINKNVEQIWEKAAQYSPAGYDAIFDGNGPSTLGDGYKHLKPVGKLVSYGFHSMFQKSSKRTNWLKLALTYFKVPRFNPLDMVTANKSIICFNVSFLFERQDILEESISGLLNWIEEGKISPPVTKSYPLENVIQAHQDLESGKTVGKLILNP